MKIDQALAAGACNIASRYHSSTITARIGQRGIAIAGLSIVLAALIIAAGSLYAGINWLLPLAAAAMLWGHLWDVFGKVCGQPVHQILGGLCRPKQRVYNTCADYGYVRSNNIKPVSTWNSDEASGPYEDHPPVRSFCHDYLEPRGRRSRLS